MQFQQQLDHNCSCMTYVCIVWNVVCIQNSRQTVKSTPYGSERRNQYDTLCCNRKRAASIILALHVLATTAWVCTCNAFKTSCWCMSDMIAIRYLRRTASDWLVDSTLCMSKTKQYINSIAKNHVVKYIPLLRRVRATNRMQHPTQRTEKSPSCLLRICTCISSGSLTVNARSIIGTHDYCHTPQGQLTHCAGRVSANTMQAHRYTMVGMILPQTACQGWKTEMLVTQMWFSNWEGADGGREESRQFTRSVAMCAW